MKLTKVDYNPFEDEPVQPIAGGYTLTKVDYDPFAEPEESTGILGALKSGAKQTANLIQTAGNVLTGDNTDVQRLTQESDRIGKTPEQEAFQQDLQKRKSEQGDDSFWQSVKNVAGATIENPTGAFYEVIGQLPNSAAVMGGMAIGAKAGATIGTAVAPGVGTVVGGIAGGIAGMFAGNTAIEMGSIAQDQTRSGEYDREDVLKKSAVKGGVITGVDTLTMGATGAMFRPFYKAANAASQSAIKAALVSKGLNPADDMAVKAAIDTIPGLKSEIVKIGAKAAADTMPKGAKGLALTGTATLLDMFGEGVGEYGGSTAAGLDASLTDAVFEAISSAPQSVGEIVISKSIASGKGLLSKPEPKQIDTAPPQSILNAQSADEAIGAFESEMGGILSSYGYADINPFNPSQKTAGQPQDLSMPFNLSESDLEAQAMESDILGQIRRRNQPVEPQRPLTPQEINQARIGMTEALDSELSDIPETDGSEWVRLEDESNAETDYWNKTREDILKQREPKPERKPTPQEINQQKIGMTEAIDQEIKDVSDVRSGYESEQTKLETESNLFQQKLDMMQNEVKNSQTRGVNQEPVNQRGETVAYSSDSPQWMRDLPPYYDKDGKKKVYDRTQLHAIFNNIKSGKELTPFQETLFGHIQKAANNYAGPAGEMVAQEEADSLEKRGFKLLGGQKMAVANLNQGDKVVATVDGVKDEFDVKDTNENGEVLLQDGVAKRVDMFDEISVEAHKPADQFVDDNKMVEPETPSEVREQELKSFKDMSHEELRAYSKAFAENKDAIIKQAAIEKAPSLYKKEVYKGKEYTTGAIVHPSTKTPGMWQTTNWDEKGFSGDSTHATKEAAIEDAFMSGYRLIGSEEFKRISKTKEFNDGIKKTADAQKANEDFFKNRQERIKELEPRLQSIFKLAADTPADLRPIDVDRVMDAAEDQGIASEFKSWFSKQDGTQEKTDTAVFTWKPEPTIENPIKPPKQPDTEVLTGEAGGDIQAPVKIDEKPTFQTRAIQPPKRIPVTPPWVIDVFTAGTFPDPVS